MNEKDTAAETADETDKIEFYDPYKWHFVSRNRQNEFLKALEEGQHETAYNTIQ